VYWTPTSWNHIAITFPGTSLKAYVNRTLQTTGTLVTAPSGSQVGYVGSSYNGFNNTGNIDCFSF
jgi:Concanavalin A-like lectin/glucanases superfamily